MPKQHVSSLASRSIPRAASPKGAERSVGGSIPGGYGGGIVPAKSPTGEGEETP
jgi:hypothetical protein